MFNAKITISRGVFEPEKVIRFLGASFCPSAVYRSALFCAVCAVVPFLPFMRFVPFVFMSIYAVYAVCVQMCAGCAVYFVSVQICAGCAVYTFLHISQRKCVTFVPFVSRFVSFVSFVSLKSTFVPFVPFASISRFMLFVPIFFPEQTDCLEETQNVIKRRQRDGLKSITAHVCADTNGTNSINLDTNDTKGSNRRLVAE